MPRIILLLIMALVSQANAQSDKLTKADPPEPASISGYDRGHCVAVSKSIRICKLLSETEDVLVVEKDGKKFGSWPVSAYMGETDDFEVLRGDLDGDGRTELIVANHDSTSNGLGVNFWSIAIFPDPDFHVFQMPLTFSVEEYGTFGTFVPARRKVNLLTTTWVWGNDPKRSRGEGLYLVGQWWRYDSGALLPSPRSTIGRRYLFSFAYERGDTMDSDRVPFRWLSHRNAEPISTDFITGSSTQSKRGVIESVSPASGTSRLRSVTIVFKPEGEPPSSFVYPADNDDGPGITRYIGDAVSHRIYPDRYLPSNPEKWLTGKRATLRSYDDKKLEILWIER